MIPLSVIFSHFSAFPFWGINKTLESGNALILWCGFKFYLLAHKKILKNGPQNFLLRELSWSFSSVRIVQGGDGETIENRARSFGPRPHLPCIGCLRVLLQPFRTHLLSTHYAVSCSKVFRNTISLYRMHLLSLLIA